MSLFCSQVLNLAFYLIGDINAKNDMDPDNVEDNDRMESYVYLIDDSSEEILDVLRTDDHRIEEEAKNRPEISMIRINEKEKEGEKAIDDKYISSTAPTAFEEGTSINSKSPIPTEVTWYDSKRYDHRSEEEAESRSEISMIKINKKGDKDEKGVDDKSIGLSVSTAIEEGTSVTYDPFTPTEVTGDVSTAIEGGTSVTYEPSTPTEVTGDVSTAIEEGILVTYDRSTSNEVTGDVSRRYGYRIEDKEESRPEISIGKINEKQEEGPEVVNDKGIDSFVSTAIEEGTSVSYGPTTLDNNSETYTVGNEDTIMVELGNVNNKINEETSSETGKRNNYPGEKSVNSEDKDVQRAESSIAKRVRVVKATPGSINASDQINKRTSQSVLGQTRDKRKKNRKITKTLLNDLALPFSPKTLMDPNQLLKSTEYKSPHSQHDSINASLTNEDDSINQEQLGYILSDGATSLLGKEKIKNSLPKSDGTTNMANFIENEVREDNYKVNQGRLEDSMTTGPVNYLDNQDQLEDNNHIYQKKYNTGSELSDRLTMARNCIRPKLGNQSQDKAVNYIKDLTSSLENDGFRNQALMLNNACSILQIELLKTDVTKIEQELEKKLEMKETSNYIKHDKKVDEGFSNPTMIFKKEETTLDQSELVDSFMHIKKDHNDDKPAARISNIYNRNASKNTPMRLNKETDDKTLAILQANPVSIKIKTISKKGSNDELVIGEDFIVTEMHCANIKDCLKIIGDMGTN